jgi:hypothetical protein
MSSRRRSIDVDLDNAALEAQRKAAHEQVFSVKSCFAEYFIIGVVSKEDSASSYVIITSLIGLSRLKRVEPRLFNKPGRNKKEPLEKLSRKHNQVVTGASKRLLGFLSVSSSVQVLPCS